MWCGVVLSVTIEAAWATGRWLAGALVALVVLDLLWLTPFVFENLGLERVAPGPVPRRLGAFAWLVANG